MAQALAREDYDTGLAACIARQKAGVLSWHHNVHEYASVLAFMTSLAAPIILALAIPPRPAVAPLGAALGADDLCRTGPAPRLRRRAQRLDRNSATSVRRDPRDMDRRGRNQPPPTQHRPACG